MTLAETQKLAELQGAFFLARRKADRARLAWEANSTTQLSLQWENAIMEYEAATNAYYDYYYEVTK